MQDLREEVIGRRAKIQHTKIPWVLNPDGSSGYVWNPIIGCQHGCQYCYGKRINDRFGLIAKWEEPEYSHDEALMNQVSKIYSLRKPSTILCGSMSDMFGEWVEQNYIKKILSYTILDHIFLFLTKNPNGYYAYEFTDNCWLGATTDTANHAGTFTDTLAILEHPHKYISAEPLLESISRYIDFEPLSWIIIGTLNFNGRPVKPKNGGTKIEWIAELIDQADKHNIPVFIKPEAYKLYPGLPVRKEIAYLKMV